MVSKTVGSAQNETTAAVLAGRRALHQRAGPAVRVFLGPGEPVALDLHLHAGGQRVHHRDADAVQAAGHRVRLAVELAAGVQRGQDDLDGRALLDRVPVDRDATAVVEDAHPAVGHQRHDDRVADTGHRLVDRVVHHLLDQVVEPALPGRTDVHSGALANCFQTLENSDRARVVGRRRCLGSHARSLPPAGSGRDLGVGTRAAALIGRTHKQRPVPLEPPHAEVSSPV